MRGSGAACWKLQGEGSPAIKKEPVDAPRSHNQVKNLEWI
jgi:hypothetical protein